MNKFDPSKVTEDMLRHLSEEDFDSFVKDGQDCFCGECLCCLAKSMKTTYIIDDVLKVYLPESGLCYNQKFLDVELPKVGDSKKSKVIVTRELNTERKFGGAFVKIALKGDDSKVFITTSFKTEEFKDLIWKYFKISPATLYRYY